MQTAPFVDLSVHHKPVDFSDRVAFGFTKAMRFCADTFFAKRYGHRAIVLETVAAVPGMVGATLTHLKCLRRMCDDQGWIRTLMEEAENERSEEHTSELQSLMRISYAVFCLKKKKQEKDIRQKERTTVQDDS